MNRPLDFSKMAKKKFVLSGSGLDHNEGHSYAEL